MKINQYGRIMQRSIILISREIIMTRPEELFNAIERNNFFEFRTLFKEASFQDKMARGPQGQTFLMEAARKGRIGIMSFLLNSHLSQKNAQDVNGWTALMYAIIRYEVGAVELLIHHGADLEIEDTDGWTALRDAAENGQDHIVKILIDNGAKLNPNGFVLSEVAKNYPETAKLIAERSVVFDHQLKESDKKNIPAGFLDPISGKIIEIPVIVNSGAAYDYYSLLNYFSENGYPNTLPCKVKEGAVIYKRELGNRPNVRLKNMLEDFVEMKSKGTKTKYTQEKIRDDLVCPVSKAPFGSGDEAAIALSSGYDISRESFRSLVATWQGEEILCPVTKIPILRREIEAYDNLLITKLLEELNPPTLAANEGASEGGRRGLKRKLKFFDAEVLAPRSDPTDAPSSGWFSRCIIS